MNWFLKLSQNQQWNEAEQNILDNINIVQDQLSEKGSHTYQDTMDQYHGAINNLVRQISTPDNIEKLEKSIIQAIGGRRSAVHIPFFHYNISLEINYEYTEYSSKDNFNIYARLLDSEYQSGFIRTSAYAWYPLPSIIDTNKLNLQSVQHILENITSKIFIEYFNNHPQNTSKLQQHVMDINPYYQHYLKELREKRLKEIQEKKIPSNPDPSNREDHKWTQYRHDLPYKAESLISSIVSRFNRVRLENQPATALSAKYENNWLNNQNARNGNQVFPPDNYIGSVLDDNDRGNQTTPWIISFLSLPYPVLSHIIDYMKSVIQQPLPKPSPVQPQAQESPELPPSTPPTQL